MMNVYELSEEFQKNADDAVKENITAEITRAVTAANGDSNDEELDALWDCVRSLACVTGIMIPDFDEDGPVER